MSNRWVISDTHFGHANILNFKDENNKPIRSFSSVEEMDEIMINNWNKLVHPDDVIYHLGDVVMNKRNLDKLSRCHGSKRLILGNHDLFDDEYPKYFKRIYAMRIFSKEGIIMTHIPIHPESLDRWKVNLHGHIHTKGIANNRYVNCCVDYVGNNYTPLSFEELRDKYK